MKLVITILLFLFAISQNIFQSKKFKVVYFNRIEINGIYDSESAEYINNIKCKIDGQLFYIADTLKEFEFSNRIWKPIIQIAKNKFQLLLEINDRPNKNKILMLTIEDNKLVNEITIPTFDTFFFDNSNNKFFIGQSEFPEAVDNNKKTQYIPTLFFIEKKTGFELDTSRTIKFNKKKWGKFYGFQPNFSLLIKPNKN